MDIRYRIAPALPLASRAILCGILFAAGVAVQLFLSWPLGWLPLLLAGFLGSARNFTNKPEDLGKEEWRPVSAAETDRIIDNLRRTRKVRLPFLVSPAAGILVAILGVIGIIVSGFAESSLLFLLSSDALAFLLPLLFSGSIFLWTPKVLQQKMECFQTIMAEPKAEGLVLTPYLRFDQDKEGRDIPEDVRMMVEPRRKPTDFVGIQLQVAINTGPNGEVPYMYAVCLTKGGGQTFQGLKGLKAQGFVVEAEPPEEYGAVVIRQRTEGGGYYTDRDDIRRLWAVCGRVLQGLEA